MIRIPARPTTAVRSCEKQLSIATTLSFPLKKHWEGFKIKMKNSIAMLSSPQKTWEFPEKHLSQRAGPLPVFPGALRG